MIKYIWTCLLIIFVLVVQGQTIVSQISGTSWTGSGSLMGNAAKFEMKWDEALDGAFVRLEFQNSFSMGNDQTWMMNAVAYYKITDDGHVSGTWLDSRGLTLPLKGTASSDTLIIEWGSTDTEQGRTTYILASTDEMRVVDEVLKDGVYRDFGSASYSRLDDH